MTDPIVVPQAGQWSRLKALVLDSVSSPITRRVTTSAWTSSSPGTARSRGPAIQAVLLGCGLRRSEVAALTLGHIQQRNRLLRRASMGFLST